MYKTEKLTGKSNAGKQAQVSHAGNIKDKQTGGHLIRWEFTKQTNRRSSHLLEIYKRDKQSDMSHAGYVQERQIGGHLTRSKRPTSIFRHFSMFYSLCHTGIPCMNTHVQASFITLFVIVTAFSWLFKYPCQWVVCILYLFLLLFIG